MAKILSSLGAKVSTDGGTVSVRASKLKPVGNYNLIRKMRGSICILGPLLGRQHHAQVSLPGGCIIGPRPIDLHLKGVRALGARVTIEAGYVHAQTKRLVGADVFLGGRAGPTVLGTANVLMAAVLPTESPPSKAPPASPRWVDLARFLNAMGAKITGAGQPHHHRRGGQRTPRGRTRGDSRPNRNRHVCHCRRDHRRGSRHPRRLPGPHLRRAR